MVEPHFGRDRAARATNRALAGRVVRERDREGAIEFVRIDATGHAHGHAAAQHLRRHANRDRGGSGQEEEESKARAHALQCISASSDSSR